jgi:CheY-like chemotaxis protein
MTGQPPPASASRSCGTPAGDRFWHDPIEILVVDDSAGDVRLTIEALRERGVSSHVSVAASGDEALDFLHRSGAFAAAPRPDLILLDLNMPGKRGGEVLAEIKRDPELSAIPVIVLTTSADERDVRASYALHANAYVVKPVDFDEFLAAVRAIEEFWLNRAVLPRAEQ